MQSNHYRELCIQDPSMSWHRCVCHTPPIVYVMLIHSISLLLLYHWNSTLRCWMFGCELGIIWMHIGCVHACYPLALVAVFACYDMYTDLQNLALLIGCKCRLIALLFCHMLKQLIIKQYCILSGYGMSWFTCMSTMFIMFGVMCSVDSTRL